MMLKLIRLPLRRIVRINYVPIFAGIKTASHRWLLITGEKNRLTSLGDSRELVSLFENSGGDDERA